MIATESAWSRHQSPAVLGSDWVHAAETKRIVDNTGADGRTHLEDGIKALGHAVDDIKVMHKIMKDKPWRIMLKPMHPKPE